MTLFRSKRLQTVLCLLLGCSFPAVAQDDTPPDVLYQQGIRLFLGGRYPEAIEKFEPIIEVFSEEPELKQALEQVYYALGSCYYNEQRNEDAVKTFEAYIQRYPDAPFVDEALFRIGAAYQSDETYDDAIEAYQRLLREKPNSDYTEDGSFQIGICYLVQDDYEHVIESFEAFEKAFPRSSLYPQAMMFLARAYFETGEGLKALDVIDRLDDVKQELDHIVYMNFLAIEIGDAAFEETDYDTALRAYRRVRTRGSLRRLQQKYIARLDGRLEAIGRRKANAQTISSHFREERRLQSALASANDMYGKLQKMPEYDAGLFHRIGSCFSNSDRFWEARVAFARVVAEAKDEAIKEAAQFDLAMVLSRLRRFDDLVKEADKYLAQHGDDPKYIENGRVASMAFMRAESYINQERFEEAEKEMVMLKETYPDFVQKERVTFYIALSMAMQEKFDEAIELFNQWLAENPEHLLRSEVEYWLPIAKFYNEQYEEALPEFQAYVEKYPMMVYAPEAGYRAALCMYSLEQFGACADTLQQWLEAYPDHYFAWEARLTRADALAADGQLEEAKTAYKLVTKEAGPFYFLALNQAAKVYKALGTDRDMREMARRFVQYVHDNPDSGNIVDAAYQAGTALRRIGKKDEARKYYWSIIERYGNNRGWEGFSALLKDLKDLYGPDEEEQEKVDFTDAYRKAEKEVRWTLASRLAMADVTDASERARQAASLDIANRYKMDVLGPEGLAFLGELFLELGRPEKGMTYFDRLLEEFPTSRHTSVAHLRRAQALLSEESYAEALKAAEQSILAAFEPEIFIEAVFVRAESRRALNMLDRATEDYNIVIANRAAPRQLKPRSMLGIAACLEAKGDYRKAIPYYQRVYVLYGAYVDEVAAAYLRSGLAFEKLKDPGAAARTYREMLENESLASTQEAEKARTRLSRLPS